MISWMAVNKPTNEMNNMDKAKQAILTSLIVMFLVIAMSGCITNESEPEVVYPIEAKFDNLEIWMGSDHEAHILGLNRLGTVKWMGTGRWALRSTDAGTRKYIITIFDSGDTFPLYLENTGQATTYFRSDVPAYGHWAPYSAPCSP